MIVSCENECGQTVLQEPGERQKSVELPLCRKAGKRDGRGIRVDESCQRYWILVGLDGAAELDLVVRVVVVLFAFDQK